MAEISTTVLEEVIQAMQNAVPDVVAGVASVLGHRVEVFYPFGTSSVYGKNDNKTRYTSKPQIKTTYLAGNVFQNAPIGTMDGSEFSSFVPEEPYIMTFKGFRLPENSKVVIHYLNSARTMKVRKHTAIDGESNYMVVFNILSPLTSSGETIEDDPELTMESNLVSTAENQNIAGQNLI
jgi:hypothetical protein